MSKTILANVDGFTPLIDGLAKELGLITAAVFGKMWRYCQFKDGVCTASLETISTDLGLDRSTVMRHIKVLVEKKYFEDTTPNLRHKPHTYIDTGKAGLSIGIMGVAQNNTPDMSVAERNTSVAQNNTSVAESHLRIPLKETLKETPRASENSEPVSLSPSVEIPVIKTVFSLPENEPTKELLPRVTPAAEDLVPPPPVKAGAATGLTADEILGPEIIARTRRYKENAPPFKRLGKALDIFASSRREGPDLSMYPVDVVEIIRLIVHLFSLSHPTGGPKLGDWIRGSRDLKQACGGSDEFTREVLLEYHKQWNSDRLDPKREALTISRPGSLVEPCRALAGRLRMASTSRAGSNGRFKRLAEITDYLNGLSGPERHQARLQMGFKFDPERHVYTPPYEVEADGNLRWYDVIKETT